MRTLLTESGNECTEPSQVMTKIKDFYSNLYKRRSMKTEEDCIEYLHILNTPHLSEAERVSCEGSLTKREYWEALTSMKNGKSPGNDGLTKEFYVCFFNEIFNYLLNASKESLNIGQLSTSQHQAIITLIEKKERDKRLIKNWRPISLMNVDAKIASKEIATRMKNVISSIIKSDQTAYVAGEYIGESIRLISDILEYVNENERSGILLSADFEKGFDSIEHPFIFAALQSFGFGPEFIQRVKTFLKGFKSCVLNNGHSTGYFPLERGTRQGDPLSAYLFILCLETLFIQIRNNDNIRGIRVGGHEMKLSAYADDADFLTPDTESLESIFQTYTTFQLYSSLKLHLEKSEACWIGIKKGSNETPVNCKWVNINCNAIHTLGIFNSYDNDLEDKLNFLDKLKFVKGVMKTWEHRGLSLAGKILIFKSLALSKLLYASTMKCQIGKF